MKRERHYYLVENLNTVDDVVQELEIMGIGYGRYHVWSKDERGLKKMHLHATSPIESSDLIHLGERGAILGMTLGLMLALALVILQPFGSLEIGWFGFFVVTILISCFGAWVGGLTGLGSENYRLKRFHNAIEKGQYLLLVDLHQDEESIVLSSLKSQFPTLKYQGSTHTGANPFDGLPFLHRLQS